MDTDRELLELAAKAYGVAPEYVWHSDPFYEGFMRRNFDESGFEIETQLWNPLTDDGDALRLAVKLELSINHGPKVIQVNSSPGSYVAEICERDRASITRRAIVRAAAEIGRAMP